MGFPGRGDPNMKGKEFEDLLMKRAKAEEAQEFPRFTMGKYGVSGAFDPRTKLWRPIRSNPDFEGATITGRQFIFDAKVLSGASIDVSAPSTAAQLKKMKHRWRFNVPTFFLIHMVARPGMNKPEPSDEEMTICLPCNPDLMIWKDVEAGKTRIHRKIIREVGYVIPWTKPTPTSRKPLPSIWKAIELCS